MISPLQYFRRHARLVRWCAAGIWLTLAVSAAEPERVIVFGTVERLTSRGAPVRGLDDAAFDQDLAEMVARAAGLPYRIVERKTAPEVLAAFDRGEIDVIPSYARLPEREGKYLFSVRHTVSTAAVFIRSDGRVPETTARVGTLRLVVAQESSAWSYLRRKNWLDGALVVATTEEAMQAVASGRAEACVSNQLIGLSVLRALKLDGEIKPGLTLVDSAVDFCMIVRRGEVGLLARLNDGLLLAFERGDLQRHREKWLPVFESYWLSRNEVRRWFAVGGVALVSLVLLAWWGYRARLRAEHRRREEVTRLVDRRTRELAAANERLRTSEELFSSAFRASPDALSITRVADGRILDVNDAFTRIFGYARDDTVGRTREELGLWIRAEERTPLMAKLRERGRVHEQMQRVRRRDGREIEIIYSTELTTIGGVECSVTISRDITEQNRVADELRRGNQLNDAIINTADGLIIALDRQGRIVRFNPACEKLSGWSAAEVAGRCFWEFLVPDEQREGVRQTFDGLIAGMFPNRHENDWVTRDGRRRWIVWANSAVLNSAGEIDLILGTGVDITAKREMTEALRLSEERYQLAVRGSSAGIWDWNLRTDEVFFAPRFKEMLGYGDAEFPPHLSAFLAVLHPEDRPALDAAVAAHLANPEMRYDIEYRLRTKGGQYRWFQSRGEALRDGAGEAHRMVGSIVDLTARKEAENDLRRLNAELELRVGERTAQLAARVEQVERLNRDQNALVVELRTSQAEADRAATHLKEANANLLAANEELEAFSYSVSHDLRAPLRNISGFVELLVKRTSGRLDAEAERFMTVVAAEAARMGRLIDDLLAFSRLGRAEMTLRPVALDAIVTEVCAELKAESGTRPIEWIIGTLPTVRGDRALLHQVIANLLGNAVKFTARREVAVIEVGVLESGSAGPHVTIFVRDNGAGFNPKYLDKLFGVFQRLHNPRDFEGTGIGLANVKRIVTRHGGRVWAEGQVNGGAVFYFTLVIAPA